MGNVIGTSLRDHPSPPNQYPNNNHPLLQYCQYQGHYPPLPCVEHHQAVTIRNDINLKKETLRFEPDEENPGKCLVSFTFDANVSGSTTVMFFAKEGAENATKGDEFPSTIISFSKGLGQPCGTGIDFSALSEIDLVEASKTDLYHVAVKAEEASDNNHPKFKTPNRQITHAVLEKDEYEYKVRVVEQILWVNGNKYVLQEIYGTGNTVDCNEMGKECVICLSEPRDTTVLPCMHMCMCSGCAKLLRFQTNFCPICRQPVDRLLEITFCQFALPHCVERQFPMFLLVLCAK